MILLDDAQSTKTKPSSRLYEQVLRSWAIYPRPSQSETIAAVDQCLLEINAALAQGEHVVAAFAYELGLYIHRIAHPSDHGEKAHPLIEAWSFKSYESFSKQDVDSFIDHKIANLEPDSQVAGVANLHFSINEDQFTTDIQAIQEYIRSGDTYQINHTFRINGETYGDPLTLYARLRNRQHLLRMDQRTFFHNHLNYSSRSKAAH